MSTLMVPNVLTLEESRYVRANISVLQEFLKKEYGEQHNYNVWQGNDRIHFQTPNASMTEETKKRLIKEIPD